MKKVNFKNSVMIAIMAIGMVMVSCGGGNKSQGGGSDKPIDECEISIKYDVEGSTLIFTRAADGNRMRMDYVYSNGDKNICIQDYDKENGYIGYRYENGEWEDDSFMARQTVGNGWYAVKDLSQNYIKYGNFTKQADITVAGKKCDVYAGEYPRDMKVAGYDEFNFVGARLEIAVWNGITMCLKENGKILREAKAVTFDVPDKAFSKTTEVTWVK